MNCEDFSKEQILDFGKHFESETLFKWLNRLTYDEFKCFIFLVFTENIKIFERHVKRDKLATSLDKILDSFEKFPLDTLERINMVTLELINDLDLENERVFRKNFFYFGTIIRGIFDPEKLFNLLTINSKSYSIELKRTLIGVLVFQSPAKGVAYFDSKSELKTDPDFFHLYFKSLSSLAPALCIKEFLLKRLEEPSATVYLSQIRRSIKLSIENISFDSDFLDEFRDSYQTAKLNIEFWQIDLIEKVIKSTSRYSSILEPVIEVSLERKSQFNYSSLGLHFMDQLELASVSKKLPTIRKLFLQMNHNPLIDWKMKVQIAGSVITNNNQKLSPGVKGKLAQFILQQQSSVNAPVYNGFLVKSVGMNLDVLNEELQVSQRDAIGISMADSLTDACSSFKVISGTEDFKKLVKMKSKF